MGNSTSGSPTNFESHNSSSVRQMRETGLSKKYIFVHKCRTGLTRLFASHRDDWRAQPKEASRSSLSRDLLLSVPIFPRSRSAERHRGCRVEDKAILGTLELEATADDQPAGMIRRPGMDRQRAAARRRLPNSRAASADPERSSLTRSIPRDHCGPTSRGSRCQCMGIDKGPLAEPLLNARPR